MGFKNFSQQNVFSMNLKQASIIISRIIKLIENFFGKYL